MCTAVSFKAGDHYFGRTLDHDFSYGEVIAVTPRKFSFRFNILNKDAIGNSIIGMAHIAEDYPLYYDAANEKGLCAAALNFVGNAVYNPEKSGFINIPHYDFIPFILANCDTVKDALSLIGKTNITDAPFSAKYPVSSLHWMIADKTDCITVEAVKEGIKIYKNPVGVLTNNPPFEMQLLRLSDYMQLSNKNPENKAFPEADLKPYSRGMGALGLPGDCSSTSRFVRAAFANRFSLKPISENDCVNQFFHIMSSVEQIKGCCEVESGNFEYTVYTSCINAERGIYYYTTYDRRSICAVDMRDYNLYGDKIFCIKL